MKSWNLVFGKKSTLETVNGTIAQSVASKITLEGFPVAHIGG